MFKSVDINGTYYQIYYPEGVDPDNVNPNTQVAIYMHGGGGQTSGGNAAVNCLTNGTNTDSIVIIPNNSNRQTQDFYDNVVNMYDSFIKENGINQNNLVISGFSNGYRSTFGILDDYLAKHPNSDPASVYLIETYVQNDGTHQYNYDAYKKNGTIFYSYTGRYDYGSRYGSLGVTYSDILDPLDNNGCNVVNMLEGRAVGHQEAEIVFFQDGIIDFSKGGLILSGDNYTYQLKNPDTGLWEAVDVSDIDTINKLRQRFGVTNVPFTVEDSYLSNLYYLSSLSLNNTTISNDSDTLLSNVGNIYSVIKGSTFVKSSYVCGGTSSTTNVPSRVSEAINQYFSAVSSVLCDLGAFMKKCENANTVMNDAEDAIAKDAGNVNNNGATNLNGGIPYTGSAPTYSQPSGNPQPRQPDTDTPEADDSDTTGDWKEEFPDYDKLHSTENKTVFNCNDEYRVIVHRDGNTIVGVEYYYDFGSSEEAENALSKIVSMYGNESVENILMKGSCVKVIFNEDMFNGLNLSEFKNKYSDLKEIVKL